jgi:putative membrane protein
VSPNPRFELEDAPVPRLEPAPLPTAEEPPTGMGDAALLAAGAGVLALGFALLGAANFVADQFARGAIQGWLTLGVAVSGFGLMGTGIWREAAGLFALRSVDRIRADLASGDAARIVAAAGAWLGEVPEGAALLPALRGLNDPDAVLALLRARLGQGLQQRADALGRAAAMQVFAATAAVPSPALDALLVGWRGARLVRQIAELHGLRPGIIGTLALLRRTALAAATVAAADVAIDAAARAALSNPLLQHLAGDVAGAGVAARRMTVLARAAAAACSPLQGASPP